jgi:glycine/D-amino acid oxidase-like deaminating enzyme
MFQDSSLLHEQDVLAQRMKPAIQDLIIIGGGVMGLCTAYYASQFVDRVTLLEKSTIGVDNKEAASFSYTRSLRNDYLDPFYARLAHEARSLWLDIQHRLRATRRDRPYEPFIIDCGCLNLAKQGVTPELPESYAEQSYQTLTGLHLKAEAFDREALQRRFPQFDADMGRLDIEAGFLYVPEVTHTLLSALHERHVQIIEGVQVKHIAQKGGHIHVQAGHSKYKTANLVITAGWGTNAILGLIEGCETQFPLIPDRPSQSKYFIPPAHKRKLFTPDVLPVFAYLDVGIYGHPLYEGRTPGVKIGFYNPPDVKGDHKGSPLHTSRIRDVHSFVQECMPSLLDAETVDVTDVDQCHYDLVEDDNFILGKLPGFSNIQVGVGWRGTGYKYAPFVGKTLMELALQQDTVYDISRFAPQRFADANKQSQGASHE